MPKVYPAPKPGPTSPALQSVADQSWYGIAGVSAPPAQTPQEAISRDPRKNRVEILKP